MDSFDSIESLFSSYPPEPTTTFEAPALDPSSDESVLKEFEHSYGSGSGYYCTIA
jgi:hypothetical protein